MKELRIGLVLYGGVSLAVYMNGIVNEIWRTLQASKTARGGGGGEMKSTAECYLKLLQDLETTEGLQPLRIVVDAIAGTSAGGLNGAVLGKALAEGGDAAVLSEVWLEEADIAKLKREPEKRAPRVVRWSLGVLTRLTGKGQEIRGKIDALEGIDWSWSRDQLFGLLTAKDGRQTPLDGDYFAAMIAKTFADMGREAEGILLPERATLDLFLTGTDLKGWPRHLPVSPDFHPEPLYERAHATWSHFRRGSGGDGLNDDFGLTFAARRTAGFPGAFAPITAQDIAKAYEAAGLTLPKDGLERLYRHHLAEHALAGFPAEKAWMVDGGVLDNRPFTQVTKAIERKPADHQVYRALVFIEPSPDNTVLDPPQGPMPKPAAVLGGLFGLFRHEPIVGDLNSLAERNRTVRRVLDSLSAAYPDMLRAAKTAGAEAGLAWPPGTADLEAWRKAANDQAAKTQPAAYAVYSALKIRRAGRLLGDLLCQALDFPAASRHAFLVRRLLERYLIERGVLAPAQADWTDQSSREGLEEAEQRDFLSAFDLRFRRQRLGWLVQAANRLYGKVERQELDRFKRHTADLLFAYDSSLADAEGLRSQLHDLFEDGEGGRRIEAQIRANDFDAEALLTTYRPAVEHLYENLKTHYKSLEKQQRGGLHNALAELGEVAFAALAEAYVTFPFVDVVAFPMMDLAGIEELSVVRALRISPLDNNSGLPSKSLLSDRFGAFAGFLERKSRVHDLLWGRLDGAERLVDIVIEAAGGGAAPSPEVENLRRHAKKALFELILEEENQRKDAPDISEIQSAVAAM
ncbi:MAG: hypothetical protein Kilf2KO_42410 [Rhodospirillales bacterium]